VRFQVVQVEKQYVDISNSRLKEDMSTPNTFFHIQLEKVKSDYLLVE
jgi:hypothetical protein